MSSETSGITADKPCLPPFPEWQERHLLKDLLKKVSRSFYLTLRVLPREVRPQVSLAYLLARASDTIADCFAIAEAERLDTLKKLRDAFATGHNLNGGRITNKTGPGILFLEPLRSRPVSKPIASVHDAQVSTAELALLEHLDECLEVLGRFSEIDQKLIGELLVTIISGQIFDLEKFPGGTKRTVTALANDGELDHYTYLVAGCVGEFWTKICISHLEPVNSWNAAKMCELGIRFGQGLQLVNVLRDIAWDLRRGRCYIPVEHPRALLTPEQFPSIQPLYCQWLDRAVEHLDAGWQYTMEIPPSLWRLRLACIWPIWIGLKTIARLRVANPLEPKERVKVSRGEVYAMMLRSFVNVRNDATLRALFEKLRDAASRR